MHIVIGLTRSHRCEDLNYVPTSDGYRPGAEQDLVAFDAALSATAQPSDVADALFEATNSPFTLDGMAAALRDGWTAAGHSRQVAPFRSVSVGDTVTVGRVVLVCDSASWTPLVQGRPWYAAQQGEEAAAHLFGPAAGAPVAQR